MRIEQSGELEPRDGPAERADPAPPRAARESPTPTPRIALLSVMAMSVSVLIAAFVGRGGDSGPDMLVVGSDAPIASPSAASGTDPDELVDVGLSDAGDGPCTVGVTFREDASGPEVRCMIARLAELGQDVDVQSDRFDDRTATALSEFQREHGLSVDGIAGPATLTQLQLWPGSTGSMVVEAGQVFTVGDGQVALTFDDGPGRYSGPVLDVLEEHGVAATFFVVGNGVAGNEATLMRILEEGHSLQNHSWDHPRLRELSWAEIEDQLANTSDAIETATGHRPTCYRPPHGATNANVRTVGSRIGLYPEFLWNVDPRDYRADVSPQELVDLSLEIADGRGLVIGLHDGGDDQSSTVEALPDIITGLRQRGYEFVTVCN